MFLDLSSSTQIAEKIGHLRFYVFLNEFFHDITDAILAAEGEIKLKGKEISVELFGIEKPGISEGCNK